jgi:hypothetical protein
MYSLSITIATIRNRLPTAVRPPSIAASRSGRIEKLRNMFNHSLNSLPSV